MSLELEPENSEDILNDALNFLGGTPVLEDDTIRYGPLTLTVAPKVRFQYKTSSHFHPRNR
jgi:hypothetical protein